MARPRDRGHPAASRHPAATQANMEQDNAHDDPPDEQGTRRAGCDDCGLPEHPDLSCAHAAELIRARTLRDLPRTHGRCSPGRQSRRPTARCPGWSARPVSDCLRAVPQSNNICFEYRYLPALPAPRPRLERGTYCLGGTFKVSPGGARCGLTRRSAAARMAGRGSVWPYACGRWLSVWLPEISLAELTLGSQEAGTGLKTRARSAVPAVRRG